MTNSNPRPLGQNFEDFLAEQGIRDEIYSTALKRVQAWLFETRPSQHDNRPLGSYGRIKPPHRA